MTEAQDFKTLAEECRRLAPDAGLEDRVALRKLALEYEAHAAAIEARPAWRVDAAGRGPNRPPGDPTYRSFARRC
jgi:hypothetical protein